MEVVIPVQHHIPDSDKATIFDWLEYYLFSMLCEILSLFLLMFLIGNYMHLVEICLFPADANSFLLGGRLDVAGVIRLALFKKIK